MKRKRPARPVRGPAATTKGSQTSPEVQAAIMGALLSGQFATDKEVAHALGTSQSNVSKQKKLIPPEYLEQVSAKKKDRIGELVMEFLEENFASFKRIDTVTHDQEWLKRQDAPGLATLYGVKADKAIKILELIQRASEPEFVDAVSDG